MKPDKVIYPKSPCPKCGGSLTFCRLLDTNGVWHVRIWCQPCYQLRPTSVTKKMQRYFNIDAARLPRYYTIQEREMRPSRKRLRNPDVIRQGQPDQAEVERLRALPYLEYLQTEHWKQMRDMALFQAKNRCQLCNGDKGLQVHHRTYERLGCEDLSDLTVLCGKCHEAFHARRDIEKRKKI